MFFIASKGLAVTSKPSLRYFVGQADTKAGPGLVCAWVPWMLCRYFRSQLCLP